MDLVGLDAGAHDGLRLEAGLHLVLDGEVDDARQVDQGDRGEHRHGQAHEESEADGSLPGPHALHILAHGLSWPGREVTRSGGYLVRGCCITAAGEPQNWNQIKLDLCGDIFHPRGRDTLELRCAG